MTPGIKFFCLLFVGYGVVIIWRLLWGSFENTEERRNDVRTLLVVIIGLVLSALTGFIVNELGGQTLRRKNREAATHMDRPFAK